MIDFNVLIKALSGYEILDSSVLAEDKGTSHWILLSSTWRWFDGHNLVPKVNTSRLKSCVKEYGYVSLTFPWHGQNTPRIGYLILIKYIQIENLGGFLYHKPAEIFHQNLGIFCKAIDELCEVS